MEEKIKNCKVVFFAETHGLIEEVSTQKEIIEMIHPRLFLYELLEECEAIDYDTFLSKPNEEQFSIISTYGDLKKTIKLAKEYNVKIKGCDIKNMCRKNKDFLKKTEFDKEEKDIMQKREEHQNREIKKALKESNTPIFVSLGYFHLRKESPTLQGLKDFAIVYPENPNKNLGYKIKINEGYELKY